ncbi:LacI family DNA-binding transcriptional regulator [Curtobacterium sp. RRHDQ10]|uniref:LacI family DNA-binding transcriptional regulator n=1 Tax=Curtobacterium phyllosphaerae TaxID=3413379 RepID=UPI003BEF82D4
MGGTVNGSTGRAPTIFDVAKHAGVSHQTVSRVINRDPTVRPPMRERVDAAVAALGYRPSAVARALASRTNRALGLVTTGGTLHGPMSTGLGFNQAARRAGYHVVMAALDDPEPGSMREAVETLLGQDVAAIVLVAADTTAIAALAALPVPVPVPLLTANGVPGMPGGGTAIAIDQVAGARSAVQHLLDRGRRRIVHLSGPLLSQEAALRRDGYVDTVRRAGLEPVLVEGDWTPESGFAAARALDPATVDGVFCGNDQMALGVLHAFAARGVSVPGAVAVVGYDDIPEAAFFLPPLTTVRQDFAALGSHILDAVDRMLAGGPARDDVTLQPSLVVRESA